MIEFDLEEKVKGTKIVHCGEKLTYRDVCELYKEYGECGCRITNYDIENQRFTWDCYTDDGWCNDVYLTFEDGSPLPLWLIESDNFEVEFYVGEVE